MMPKRIQRKRTTGWRLPEGAICVTRPGKFGNPWGTAEEYREYILSDALTARKMRRVIKRELAGKDLACWCPLDQPCHADVQLEIANS